MKVWWLFLGFAGVGLAGAQEREVDPFGGVNLESGSAPVIHNKWRRIVLPKFVFVNTPLEDALEFFRSKSVELDSAETDPKKKGINIVLKTSPGWSAGKVVLEDDKPFSFTGESPGITMTMNQVPIGEALRHVAERVGLEVRLEGTTAVVGPPAEDVGGLMAELAATGPAVSGWKNEALYAGSAEVPFPKTSMLEALQSEYRKLGVLEERLVVNGVSAEDAEREALEGRMEKTRIRIEEARKLLVAFWKAERLIGEGWLEEEAK